MASLRSIVMILLTLGTLAFGERVTRYQQYTGLAYSASEGVNYIVFRKFEMNQQWHYLVVHPNTFRTSVIKESSNISVRPLSQDALISMLNNTAYVRSLIKTTSSPMTVYDTTNSNTLPKNLGIDYSIDLCASHNPLDRKVLTELFAETESESLGTIPIALNVTGIWMVDQNADLEWFKQLEKEKRLEIVWVNHSYNHSMKRVQESNHNPLKKEGIKVEFEVFHNEVTMLEKGIVPSIFFRFPGFSPDIEQCKKIASWGLIPIGADTWLSKKRWPRHASFVFMNGCGNTPIDISRFMKLLKDDRVSIVNREWQVLDLRNIVNALNYDKGLPLLAEKTDK